MKKGLKPNYSTENIKLLCKDGKYHLNNEVKYADRKISKSEESNGNFIYIQPKQSTETIKDWFGVERYKTSLKLKNCIILKDRRDFDSEIKDIKIATMNIIDQNRKNVDILKRIEIIPCTEIEVYDLEQENKELFLEDYFFVEQDNSYYIKIPCEFQISKIRISEMFPLSIIEILKQALTLSFDNDTSLLELLITRDSEAKKRKITDLFGVDSWNISNELLYNKNIKNEAVVSYFRKNGLSREFIDLVSKIDFTSDLNQSDFKIVIESLKQISKDITDLNDCSDILNISLIPFYQSEIKKLMNSEVVKYRNNLYNIITTSKIGYSDFLGKIELFKNYDTKKFCLKDTVLIDLQELLYEQFPELKNDCQVTISPDDIYNSNVKKILTKLNISSDDFDYFIQNHKDQKSIIYFEIPESILCKIKDFLTSNNSKTEDEKNKSFSDNINPTTIKTKLMTSKKTNNELTIKRGITEKSKRDYEKNNLQNENAGKSAEEIAYYELKKTYKNLIWHSKNSQIPADRNNPPSNGIICDMWNSDPENGNLYFEVKSSTTEFELSINEYKSMENNKDNYVIILVNRDTQEISHHYFEELEEFKQINSYIYKFEQEKI